MVKYEYLKQLNMHNHGKEKHKNKRVRKQPLACAHFILEMIF